MTHKDFCNAHYLNCMNAYKEFGDKEFKELAEIWESLADTSSLDEIKLTDFDDDTPPWEA